MDFILLYLNRFFKKQRNRNIQHDQVEHTSFHGTVKSRNSSYVLSDFLKICFSRSDQAKV